MNEKILVVDDEPSIVDLIKLELEFEGYEVSVAYDGLEAIEQSEIFNPDLIVLDIMLPKMNGYDVCKEISMTKEIPIIFLTAKNEMIDKVLGLEIGGDDYLTKPFDTRELLARIKALLRRSKKKNTSRETSPDNNTPLVADSIKNAELQIFLKERTVLINNEEVHLTPKEFDLLYLLMDNLEQVFSREILLEKIWGYDYYGGTRTVDMHIRRLRKKIEITDKKYIQTVFGVGYKMKKF